MNKRDRFNIDIPESLDMAIDNGINKGYKEIQNKKLSKRKLITGISAASLVLFITFGITNPTFAAKLPIVGNVFKAIEKSLIFPSEYSKYATAVNETVTDNGLSITLSEILCDGQSLYVTYTVESEEPFKYTSYDNSGTMNMNQLITNEAYHNVDFTNEKLDTWGFTGLEGEFVDEHTFVGLEEYKLNSNDADIPDEFIFKNKIIYVENYDVTSDKTTVIRGEWAFEVPVKVDKSLRKVVDISGIENEFIKVNSLSITPFEMVVNIKYNKGEWHEYSTTFYDENGEILKNSQNNVDDNTGEEKLFMQSPNQNSNFIRIVVEKTSELKNYEKYEDIPKDAIFDKRIDIK